MKQIAITMAVALTAISCSSTIKGEGDITTIKSSVNASATEINVSNAIKLTLSDQLQPGELSIATYENIHPYIKISNKSDELSIEMKDGQYKNLHISVIASSMQYSEIEASGASDVEIKGEAATFANYSIDLSGASRFTGELNIANYLDIDLSGASNVTISGETDRCEVEVSGASKLYDKSFKCNTLDIDASGASKVQLSVVKSITGELSGASKLQYKGTPSVSVDASGASSVNSI